jgi:hypothetical protein
MSEQERPDDFPSQPTRPMTLEERKEAIKDLRAKLMQAEHGYSRPNRTDAHASQRTLREHYAGLMMAAGLSALTDDSDPVTPAEAARCAIANADALLAALSKAQP